MAIEDTATIEDAVAPPPAHARRESHPAISTFVLFLFVVTALAVGVGGSILTAPAIDGWYADAEKPPWTPPDIVFAPVWAALYLAMAVAAWLVWRRRHRADVRSALAAYVAQLVVNAIWSPIFFGLYPVWGAAALWLAFGVIVALILLVLFTTLRFWQVHRFAAVLLMPSLAWIVYAASLNATIAAYAS